MLLAAVIRKHTDDVRRRPPLFSEVPGCRDVEWICEAARVGHDMDELCQHLFDKKFSDKQIRQALATLETPESIKIEKNGEHSGDRFLLAAS
jgi:hypothetical protein